MELMWKCVPAFVGGLLAALFCTACAEQDILDYLPEKTEAFFYLNGEKTAHNLQFEEMRKLTSGDKTFLAAENNLKAMGLDFSDFENEYLLFRSGKGGIQGVVRSRNARAEKLFLELVSEVEQGRAEHFRGTVVPFENRKAIRLAVAGGDFFFMIQTAPDEIQILSPEPGKELEKLKVHRARSRAGLGITSETLMIAGGSKAALPQESIGFFKGLEKFDFVLRSEKGIMLFDLRALFDSKENAFEQKGRIDLLFAAALQRGGTNRKFLESLKTSIEDGRELIVTFDVGNYLLHSIRLNGGTPGFPLLPEQNKKTTSRAAHVPESV